ncbi:MAG TPA: efflux RND transporter periplasmic adaptor subunit [Steroidobacteraceae bacterium]
MRTKLWSLSLIGALALITAACTQESSDTREKRTPVRAVTATTGPSTPPISTTGTVATKDEMQLSFKVGGVIKRIYVEEGDEVRQGQKLAEIELTEIEAQLEQARQLAQKAQRDLQRGERLYADEVISLEQLEDLRTQAALQQAQLKSIAFNRNYAVITAPGDGVVMRKLAQERELVPAGQAVLILGARDRGYVVRAALADREIVQLKHGDDAEIRLDAYPGRPLSGTLVEISGAADPGTGLFPVEIQLNAVPVQLVSGLVAKVTLHPASGREHELTYVPISAIVEGHKDRASVFVVDGDVARRRDVRVAFIGPESVALAEGLEPGERVVTDGALYLEDAEPIEIVQDATATVGN